MRRVELAALCSKAISWDELLPAVDPLLDSVGLSPGGKDVKLEIDDRGELGRILTFDRSASARRAAVALAVKTQAPVKVFEVVATVGKVFRFRTEAFLATAQGELKPAEGKELDLEDPQGFTGDLLEQAHQVLEAFAGFDYGAQKRELKSYGKRKAGKPSSPRLAALLASIHKARAHEGVPQPDGRVELRIELAAGGKQRSYCTAAEYEELQKLLDA